METGVALLTATEDPDVPVVLQALDGLSSACKNIEPVTARVHALAESLLDPVKGLMASGLPSVSQIAFPALTLAVLL